MNDPRVWAVVGAMVVVSVADVMFPDVVALPLLCVPVLVAALFAGPGVVASLAAFGILLAVATGVANNYFSDSSDWFWLATMFGVGVFAVALSALRTREAEVASRSHALLKATLRTELDPHVLLDPVRDDTGAIVDFVYSDANEAACAFTRRARDEFVGQRMLEVSPPAMRRGILATYAAAYESQEPLILDDYSYPVSTHVEERRFDIRAVRVLDSLSLVWRDVTDRQLEVQRVAESERRYRLLTENASDVILHLRGGEFVWASPALTTALGWDPDEWIGRRGAEFVHPDDLAAMSQAHVPLVDASASLVGRYRVLAKGGSYHWVEWHARAFVDSDGTLDGTWASFRVVDAEVAAEYDLQHRARYDALTGLLSRSEIIAQVDAIAEHHTRSGDRAAVLFCDLDGLKLVNDTYGHSAGDALLRETGQRIVTAIRSGDATSRYGGDEFLVILRAVRDLADAIRIAKTICAACAGDITVDGVGVPAGLSIGVTLARSGDTADSIIDRADRALYEAKASGRDCVVASAP